MLKDLQRALVRILRSPSPAEEILREAASADEATRAALERADPDGLLLSRLLVLKLRFERICRGDARAARWFERDSAGFTTAFRSYDQEVPQREYFPREEAMSFREWCLEQGHAVEWGDEISGTRTPPAPSNPA